MKEIRAKRLNQELIQKLQALNHIQSPAVAAAFLATPRHFFAPTLADAYENRPLALKQAGDAWISSISQPSMIAIMLEQLELRPGMQVLEIGAGSGYNAALMAHLVTSDADAPDGHVTTLDIDQDLVDGARANLAAAGVANVEVVCADGGLGHAANAPYDRIILSVGAADISPHWPAQLASGGRLLLPLQIGTGQLSVAFDQVADEQVADEQVVDEQVADDQAAERSAGYMESRSIKECSFIRLRGTYAAPDIAPLELAPGVDLFAPTEAASRQAAQMLGWLRQRAREWSTGVQITPRDFWRGLGLWLALHEPDIAGLRTTQQAMDRGLVPLLYLFAEESAVVTTAILCGQNGLAALVRPPVPHGIHPEAAEADPFELMVCQCGVDDAPARRLAALVQAWETAGRPSANELRVVAYPKRAATRPATTGFLVEKPETWLVLDYPTRR